MVPQSFIDFSVHVYKVAVLILVKQHRSFLVKTVFCLFSGDPESSFCSWYLSIREGGITVLEHNLCISDLREIEIFRSASEHVEMFVMGTSSLDSLPPFLVEYKGELFGSVSARRGSGLGASKIGSVAWCCPKRNGIHKRSAAHSFSSAIRKSCVIKMKCELVIDL